MMVSLSDRATYAQQCCTTIIVCFRLAVWLVLMVVVTTSCGVLYGFMGFGFALGIFQLIRKLEKERWMVGGRGRHYVWLSELSLSLDLKSMD